ncbi:MAG: oligosaccharide flippase family protein, partial [Gammaproteobacteria bacterium]|nr:oligosaccharide flippase family protein [Gammaproteobacteria bacterium]
MTQTDRDIRDIVRGTGANILGFVARFGSRVPFIFLAGLLFGAPAFGRYVLVIAIIETIACLPVLALNRTLFHFLNEAELRADREHFHRTLMSGVVVAAATGLLSAGLVFVAADAIALAFRSPDVGQLLRLLAVTLPMTTVSTVLLAATRHRRIMRYEIYTRNIVEPLTLSIGVAVLYFLDQRESGLVIAHVVSLALGFGFAVYCFAKMFSIKRCLTAGFDFTQINAIARFSAPTAVYDFLNVAILRVDIMLLAYFTTESVVGIYGMAIQFVTFAKKIRQAFDPILTPIVSQGLAENDVARVKHQLTLVSRWVLSAQMAVLLLFAFYAERLLGLVGEAFSDGALTLA